MPLPRNDNPLPPTTRIAHEMCWAKTTSDGQPGINVRDHGLNVGCVAEALVDLLPDHLRALLPSGVATLAALHDIGKVSPGFQAKCPAWRAKHALDEVAKKQDWDLCESHHGKVTAFALREYFRAKWGDHRWERVAHCIGAHHGSLFGNLFAKPSKDDRLLEHSAPWSRQRHELITELEQLLGRLPAKPRKRSDRALWCLAGFVTVADWIGSNEDFFTGTSEQARTVEAAKKDAKRAIADIGWGTTRLRPELGFADLFGFDTPSGIQAQTVGLAESPSVVLIEASMGTGKTEAALWLAYRLIESGQASGLYFALPTQVTSNRIHLRVRKFLRQAAAEPALLRLAHSHSWLRDNACAMISPASCDDTTPAVARQWFASSNKRALLGLASK